VCGYEHNLARGNKNNKAISRVEIKMARQFTLIA